MENLKEKLYRAIDLFDLEEYLENNFDCKRSSNREEVRVNCFAPNGCAGSDYKHHLYVNIDKKKWICFKCHYGDRRQQIGSSTLIRFIADAEGVTYASVLERFLGVVVPTPEGSLYEILEKAFALEEAKDEHKPMIVELPKTLRQLRSRSIRVPTPRRFYDYGIKRGLLPEDFNKHDVRFVVKTTFKPEGKREKEFQWLWRIVFPIVDLEGNYRSAIGRTISEKRCYWTRPSWSVWPDTDIRDLLWPLGFWIRPGKWIPWKDKSQLPIVLTEGIFDAHAVNRLTDFQSLCTFGKKISNEQIYLLSQMGIKQVILAWDCDAKTQIKNATKKLNGKFDVFVFPFKAAGWREFDFGDVLARKMDDYEQAQKIMIEELNSALSIESPEYCAWDI